MRTAGSRSLNPARARLMFAGDSREASSVRALARAIAGVAGSPATAARSAGSAGAIVPRGVECRGIGLEAFPLRPEPPLDGRGRPGRRLVAMAIVAGVGRAEADRKIRPRDAETVIVPCIHDHVGAGGHVTGGASDCRLDAIMVTVARGFVLVGLMALQTHAVAGEKKFRTVRIVAIAAADAGSEHLALLERAVVVDLVQHLSIGLVKALRQRRHRVGIGQPAARDPGFGKLGASGVTKPASLDLLAQQARRHAAVRIA